MQFDIIDMRAGYSPEQLVPKLAICFGYPQHFWHQKSPNVYFRSPNHNGDQFHPSLNTYKFIFIDSYSVIGVLPTLLNPTWP